MGHGATEAARKVLRCEVQVYYGGFYMWVAGRGESGRPVGEASIRMR